MHPTPIDVAVLGTGPVEAIAAAALAHAGLAVAHIDPSQRYGFSVFSALGLTDLLDLVTEGSTAASPPAARVAGGASVVKAASGVDAPQVQTQPPPASRFTDVRVEIFNGQDDAHSSEASPSHVAAYLRQVVSDPAAAEDSRWPRLAAIAPVARAFAIELYPKLFFASGPVVNSLIRADMGAYLEYKLVEGMYVRRRALPSPSSASLPSPSPSPSPHPASAAQTSHEANWTLVHTSKEDIFADSSLSLIEKRKLMRVLSACAGKSLDTKAATAPSPHTQTAPSSPAESFTAFLSRLGVPSALQTALAHALGPPLADPDAVSALARSRLFFASLGRYGPSPYLCGIYGTVSELVMAFARRCAVWGGTTVLGKKIALSLVSEADNDVQSPSSSIHVKDHLQQQHVRISVSPDESSGRNVTVPVQEPRSNETDPSSSLDFVARSCIAVTYIRPEPLRHTIIIGRVSDSTPNNAGDARSSSDPSMTGNETQNRPMQFASDRVALFTDPARGTALYLPHATHAAPKGYAVVHVFEHVSFSTDAGARTEQEEQKTLKSHWACTLVDEPVLGVSFIHELGSDWRTQIPNSASVHTVSSMLYEKGDPFSFEHVVQDARKCVEAALQACQVDMDGDRVKDALRLFDAA